MNIQTAPINKPTTPAPPTSAAAVSRSAAPEAPTPPPEDQVGSSEGLPDPTTDIKNWFFTQKRVPGQNTQGSPFNKLTLGMVVGAGAWAAYKVGMDVAASATLATATAKVALNCAALAGGYVAADLPSGLLHHWADNYADPNSKNPFTRKFAKQAQRHHFHPNELGHYTLSAWASPLSIVGWAPLAGAAALGAPSPILSSTIGLVAGMSAYGVYHEWSHTPQKDLPPIARFMQKTGLAIDPKAHWQHHKMPWNSDYCIVTGHLNKPLNAIKFWPRYEKAIFAVTGKAPESWNVKEYKDFVDGKITRAEYNSKAHEIMQNFHDNQAKVIKEKWGID